MPRKTDSEPQAKVELWSGHDVNLTIPTQYGFGGHEMQLARPTLAQVREFLRAAADAGYGDDTPVTVKDSGLRVRRGGVS